MRNILLSAFSIPVMRAVCCNLNLNFIFFNGSHYLLLLKYSVQNGDIEWILFCSFVFIFYFLFLKEKNDQRSLTDLLFCCFCFWSMLSFIGETTVCVFWQLSTLSCSPTNFVPLLKTINKKIKVYPCLVTKISLCIFVFEFFFFFCRGHLTHTHTHTHLHN